MNRIKIIVSKEWAEMTLPLGARHVIHASKPHMLTRIR